VYKKHTGKIIRIIIGAVIHSSFCVFNFMLPTCRPNFSRVGSHHVISLAGPCLVPVIFLVQLYTGCINYWCIYLWCVCVFLSKKYGPIEMWIMLCYFRRV